MIELRGVDYWYGDRSIFAGVDLSIKEGSFHFLTGPSGAGKTTLLRMCFGDLIPVKGSVQVLDKTTADLSRDERAQLRRRIGVVQQDCQFLDHLSVIENIALPLMVAGRSPADHESELNDLVQWVGLQDYRSARPNTLSGGERQRAALARAVILSPDIVIADEPTGNVDWAMAQRIMTLLSELNRMGKTVILATHDLNLIRWSSSKVTAKVLRLSQQKLVEAGSEL